MLFYRMISRYAIVSKTKGAIIMKVLFLTNVPSPYRVDFFNELGELCELTVLYERKKASYRNDKWMSDNSANFKSVFLKGINIKKDTSINFEVIKYLDKKLFDIIVIGGYSTPTGMMAIEYCKIRKIPFVLNADGGMIGSENKVKYKLKRHFIQSASVWLSTGFNTSRYLIHYGAKERIYRYPFTSIREKDIIDKPLTIEEKKLIKTKLGLEDKPTAIAVGRFIYDKGLDVLIDSWKNVSNDYNLLIIGGGEEKDNLIAQIEKNNLDNIKLLDYMDPADLVDYYKASDIFILPTRGDVWGLVVNEAMANGLPVITTDKCVAGLELITEGKNGYIVPINDENALSLRANELLSNKNLQEDMSKRNIERIKMYTIENMAKKHMDIFKTINFRNEVDNYYIYE